jgi:hypothetical protein
VVNTTPAFEVNTQLLPLLPLLPVTPTVLPNDQKEAKLLPNGLGSNLSGTDHDFALSEEVTTTLLPEDLGHPNAVTTVTPTLLPNDFGSNQILLPTTLSSIEEEYGSNGSSNTKKNKDNTLDSNPADPDPASPADADNVLEMPERKQPSVIVQTKYIRAAQAASAPTMGSTEAEIVASIDKGHVTRVKLLLEQGKWKKASEEADNIDDAERRATWLAEIEKQMKAHYALVA